MSMFKRCMMCLFMTLIALAASAQESKPLRLGIAGISHGHLNEVVVRLHRGDFEVVGVAEPDASLRARNVLSAKLDPSLFFASLEEMLDKTHPEAVVAYGSIYDHLAVVEACAPRGIHVMVEKPLAVNMEHAERMAQLARANNTLLLTNYETTWYNTNHEAYNIINQDNAIGEVRRMEIYDGHQGPIEIGCGREFTSWLTDPKLNGGGAVIDFGCYGANLATWLMNGEKPKSVYAILKQMKPETYPNVDDDATIVLDYPSATVQIMGSWCWPMSRKDMHIYGSNGYVFQYTPDAMQVNIGGKVFNQTATKLQAPFNDSFLYLKAAVRKEIEVKPTDLSALENNLTVVQILDAAKKSAKSGKPVVFKKH